MKKMFFVLSLVAMALTATAVPAKRGVWKTLTLADGTEVKAQLVGDEHGHYWKAADGKAYVKAAGAAFYEEADASALEQKARVRRGQVNAQRVKRLAARRKAASYTGKKKGLILLVNFSDMQFKSEDNNALYQRIANEEGFSEGNFKGSMCDYFKAQSLGQFELDFDVVGPLTVSKSYAYYGENDADGNDMYAGEMVCEAVGLAKDQVTDWAQYDWDGDGYVDQVYVVYAGQGEADGGAENTIWPHAYDLESAAYFGDGTGAVTVATGLQVNTYACGAELDGFTSDVAGIGTMCHEFSHCLGYPDFYDTDYSGGQGMGYWDLMSSGSYNGNGYQPAGYTSYERWVAGWEEPTELTATQSISNMAALQSGGGSYIIYNKGNSNEYFLLENRQKVGWDASLPGAGLLILHVDYDADVWGRNKPNDDPSHQRMTWIAADNNYQYTESNNTKYYVFSGMATDPYPCGTNNSFGRYTTPAAKLYNANDDGTYYLDAAVENITQNSDSTVAFQFKSGSDVTAPLSETVDFNSQGYGNATAVTSASGTYCTVTFDKGTNNSNSPAYYTDGYAVRLYSGNTMTVASASKTIVEMTLTAGTGDGSSTITTDVGTYSDRTWTGSASRVTFTIAGNEGQRRIAKVTVTYAEGQETTPDTPDTPATDVGNVYELITDATTLSAGDEILIAYVSGSTAKALSTTQNTNNRSAVDVTKNADGTLTPGDEAQVITLEKDGGNFLFNVGNGYLYAASSDYNYLKTEATADDNAKAAITISSGEATIAFQGSNTRNLLRYNPNTAYSNPLFSCYASSTVGSLPQIYRKVLDVTVAIGPVGYSTLYYSDKNLLLPQGVEAYSYTLHNGLLQSDAVDGIIAKGTAVVLKDTQADGSSPHSYRFAVVNTGTAPAVNCLYGYDQENTTSVGGDYKYYMLSLNAAGEPSSVGFYYGDDDGAPFTCGAHKAFLALPRIQSSGTTAYLLDGSIPNGMTAAVGGSNNARDRVFNLNGQRIEHPSRPGIYIVGSRKVIVR